MESMGKKPRRRRSFTPEFKAEMVELCQRGDRSAGQVARDFDLTETARSGNGSGKPSGMPGTGRTAA
jgi:transposase-like protein